VLIGPPHPCCMIVKLYRIKISPAAHEKLSVNHPILVVL